MESLDRRSALVFGLTVAAIPLLTSAGLAVGKTYGPDEGKQLYPGVRVVEIGKLDSEISAYKSIALIDVVFQPGAVAPESVMDSDMVCHITSGEFKIKKGANQFTVKEGDVYTCGKGKTDMATNTSSVVGVHRIAVLIPA